MILAVAFRLARGEAPFIGGNLILGGLAVFLAWGRLRRAPTRPRA